MSPRRPRRVADLLNPAAVLLPAANVIMQLAAPGVGYGVLESPVDSGNVYQHPFKRARTTGTYLAAATVGTDADRALIRAAVDTAHAQVRSTASSPVSYNAFDPNLQLWVASCLYRYYVDQHEFLYGPLGDAVAVGCGAATPFRVAVDRASTGRPGDSPPGLARRLSALSVGYAGSRASRSQDHLSLATP
jgi:uncharacterized protein (DUF2236 family)